MRQPAPYQYIFEAVIYSWNRKIYALRTAAFNKISGDIPRGIANGKYARALVRSKDFAADKTRPYHLPGRGCVAARGTARGQRGRRVRTSGGRIRCEVRPDNDRLNVAASIVSLSPCIRRPLSSFLFLSALCFLLLLLLLLLLILVICF
jgi:hypothetical protein